MLAIYKRELKSYFTSVIACLFISVITLISGIFFVYYNLTYGTPEMYSVYQCLMILVFTVPILTMKIIADERKQKTDQLILTAPISVAKIILGKFFALVTIYIIPILIMCLYPIILSKFGTVSFKTAYTNIFGLFLYGVAFIAIGIFISSITESQVISAILSIVVLFMGYIMQSVESMISSTGNILTKILGCFDLYTPVQDFLNGVITLSAVVYYISITALFLFLTCQSIQKRRWNVSKKTIGTGVFSVGFIAIVLAVTVFANVIATTVTSKVSFATIDMTSTSLYSITSDTKNMLKKLDSDVTVYVMAQEANADSTIKKTLERYKTSSKHVKVEYKDTTLYPNFYQEYTDTAPTSNSLIVVNEKTKKSKVVDYNDIYVSDSYSYYMTGSSSATSYDCEGQLNSALAYVRTNETYKLYQVEGHDEVVTDSSSFGTISNLEEIITKYNAEIENIKLINRDKITTDECAALLILGPEKDYTEEEAKIVIDYLNNGGQVIIALENLTSQSVDKPNFNSILSELGIKVQSGVVAENDSSFYSTQYGPWFAFAEGEAGYATGLSSYVFAPYSAGLTKAADVDDSITYTALASTSDDSVLKTNAAKATKYEKEDGDVDGPFDLIIAVEKTITTESNDDANESKNTEESTSVSDDADSSEDSDTTEDTDSTEETKTARALVFSSVYSLSDSMDNSVSNSNTQVVNNALKEYIDTEVETVSVPAKSLSSETLTVTDSGTRMFGILISVVLPILVLAAGIGVWAKRRKR